MTKRYYDPAERALVYTHKVATPDFWDKHWHINNGLTKSIQSTNPFVNKISSKYLHSGSRILEGGCGLGYNVFSLQQEGFETYGIDFASKTVAIINNHVPELKVLEGDVRYLPFKNNFFDGYWSIGVIEHFYNGFECIAKEMVRTIKSGGYLFITFPQMHLLRKLKAKLGMFQPLPKDFNPVPNDFYQYALNTDTVKNYLISIGFDFIQKKEIDGLKGFKDEISIFKPVLQKLYDSRSPFLKLPAKAIDLICIKWAAHSVLLIMRKNL